MTCYRYGLNGLLLKKSIELLFLSATESLGLNKCLTFKKFLKPFFESRFGMQVFTAERSVSEVINERVTTGQDSVSRRLQFVDDLQNDLQRLYEALRRTNERFLKSLTDNEKSVVPTVAALNLLDHYIKEDETAIDLLNALESIGREDLARLLYPQRYPSIRRPWGILCLFALLCFVLLYCSYKHNLSIYNLFYRKNRLRQP